MLQKQRSVPKGKAHSGHSLSDTQHRMLPLLHWCLRNSVRLSDRKLSLLPAQATCYGQRYYCLLFKHKASPCSDLSKQCFENFFGVKNQMQIWLMPVALHQKNILYPNICTHFQGSKQGQLDGQWLVQLHKAQAQFNVLLSLSRNSSFLNKASHIFIWHWAPQIM